MTTTYTIIEHRNSNRRRHERNEKNPVTISHQYVRKGPRAVDVKRAERLAKKSNQPTPLS